MPKIAQDLTQLIGNTPLLDLSRYARREEHGHYLVCTQCHSRIRLQECPLTAMEKELERETGFSIDRHQLTLYGKCPACRKREK